MLSIFKDCFSKRAVFFVMLPVFVGGVLFVANPNHALAVDPPAGQPAAQPATATPPPVKTPISPTDLTPAKGWKCDNSSGLPTDCTNTDTKSSFYKATATCVNFSSEAGIEIICQAILPNGDKINNSQTIGAFQSPVTENTQVDKNNNVVASDTHTESSSGCGISSFSNIGQCIVNAIGAPILLISSFLLGIAGVLFNLVVVKTVFQFSSLIGNAPGLLLAWGILRDIGNMILLFGFIFMGLATILDLHTYTAKKALPQLIIFAVLMNFSLFAAEAIIDTSNVFSTILYSQANNSPCAFGGTLNATKTAGVSSGNSGDANINASEDSINGCINDGIAGSIMQASGLSTIFSARNTLDISLSVYIGLSLFAIIGAVVMFAASIMLVIRALTLTFLMVLAPLGFAGMAVPMLQKMAGKWWNMLIHQAFFAPILLLLIFVSLKVSEAFSATGGTAGLAGALSDPNVTTMGIILVFTLIMGFLIASLVAAKSFGAMGADFAIKTAGNVGFGVTGWAGRATGGRASAWTARKVRESRIGSTEWGRRLALIGDKGAHASFDVRGIPGVSKIPKLDMGKAQHGGFHKSVEDVRDARVRYAKTLKGGTETARDREERIAGLEAASATAGAATDTQLAAANAASSAHQDATNSRAAEEQKLQQFKTLAARSPKNADLQKKFAEQEKKVQQQQEKEAEAEKKLTEETTKLAEVREAERVARETEQAAREGGRIKMDKKKQQTSYATDLEERSHRRWERIPKLFGITAHGRHEAVERIRAEIKKSPAEKAIEARLDAIKRSIEAGNETSHDDVVAAAAGEEGSGHGGGGGGHAH
ncbi:MAG: hypothetical protein JWN49_17 [Parcubacteria group bacterium]|nr:hypothetical protein [Parcubacteria group bacterium]